MDERDPTRGPSEDAPSGDEGLAIAADVAEVRQSLARADAEERAGRPEPGLALARDALVRAESLAFEPLIAEASLRVGNLQGEVGHPAESEESLQRAYFLAEVHGMTTLSLDAAIQLVYKVGSSLRRVEDGERWARQARALLDRGAGDRIDESRLLANLGALLSTSSRYDEAEAAYREAIELRAGVDGPDSLGAAIMLNNLGLAVANLGRLDEALEIQQRALAIRQRFLGERHPDVAMSHANLAGVLVRLGQLPEALEECELALAIGEPTLGSDHPMMISTLSIMASVRYQLGETEAALEAARRVVENRERALGPDNPALAADLMNYGGIICASRPATPRVRSPCSVAPRQSATSAVCPGPSATRNCSITAGPCGKTRPSGTARWPWSSEPGRRWDRAGRRAISPTASQRGSATTRAEPHFFSRVRARNALTCSQASPAASVS